MIQRNEWLKYGGMLLLAVLALGAWQLANSSRRERTQLVTALRTHAWQIVLPAAAGCVGLAAIPLYRRRQRTRQAAALQERVASGPTFLLLPRSDWKPVDASRLSLWGRLADALPHDEHIAFELGGSESGIAFSLHASEDGLRAALTQIKAEWPGVQRRAAEPDPTALPDGWHVWWCECCPATLKEPITTLASDPLRAVVVEVNGVIGQGRGLVQVIARSDFGTRKRLGQAAFAARAEKVANGGVRALRAKEARSLEERADRTFLQATVRAVGMADTPSRAQGIARRLARAICAGFGHSNPVKVVREGQDVQVVQQRTPGKSMPWADNELASLAHLVGSDILSLAPRLLSASAQSLPPAPVMVIRP